MVLVKACGCTFVFVPGKGLWWLARQCCDSEHVHSDDGVMVGMTVTMDSAGHKGLSQ